jgi:Ca2+-dependent lipid-binding protein
MDLPAADTNGLADPYIMIMWEKDALEEVSIKFGAKLQRFFFGKARWPRTPHRPKTLYPEWKEEEIILRTKNGDVPPGTKLFLVLVDYDALSKDDYMCTTCLDLAELMDMGPDEKEKMIPFYRHLQNHGRNTGRIKFHVDVKRENMQRRKSFFYRPSQFPEAGQYLSDSSFKSAFSETTI